MFSAPELQRLISGDNVDLDLTDLKYVSVILGRKSYVQFLLADILVSTTTRAVSYFFYIAILHCPHFHFL